MPGGRQRSGLRLTITDHTGDDEIRIVEGRSKGVRERVTELAPLVDRAGDIGRAMARNTPRKGKLFKETLHPRGISRYAGIELAVAALEPGVGYECRSPMAGPADRKPVHTPLVE